jgi:hypothetical protein
MIVVYAGLALGALVLGCVSIFLFLPYVWLNGFLEGRITRAFEEAYPAYSIHIAGLHYRIWENRLECDSIRIMKIDSTVSCSVTMFSMSGIDRMRLLKEKGVASEVLASSHGDAQGFMLTFVKSQYELHCSRLQISVPDSSIVMEQFKLHPSVDDDQFFAGSKFMGTRYLVDIPQARVTGVDCLGLLQGKKYLARAAQIQDVFFSALIDKDKPSEGNTPSPLMPNVILASIKESIYVDSIRIMNGRLEYSERYHVGSPPAVLTWDSLQIMAEGVGNTANRSDTAIIRVQGIFMNATTINMQMSIPLASPELSFRLSGFSNEMNLSNLNPFLGIAERKRIKTGILHRASFDFYVTHGSASGNVRAVYKDLSIALVEDRTGSESGLSKTIASFIANNVTLRTTNIPDKFGPMKIGEVKYRRNGHETFLQFAWFSLLSGLKDVGGF